MRQKLRGYTLVELMVGMAIMGIVCAAFAGLLKYVMKATTTLDARGESQEQARETMMKVEEYASHANQIQVASSTFVQYIVDIDQSPNYNRNQLDCNGIPFYRSADRDCDADLLAPASAQWKIGYKLKDDDEDGDGKIDVMERIYFSTGAKGGTLWFDMSVNEAPWGGEHLKKIGVNISSFTISYWGDKSVPLDKTLDDNGDGVISAGEMDAHGNADGALDTPQEFQYITWLRIDMTVDYNHDGKTDYAVETDIYPPMLPLKPQAP